MMAGVDVEALSRSGDRDRADRDSAARALFAEHYPRLAGWCRRLVDDDASAHDVAAEAFTRLLLHWDRAEDPRGYLYVIATNLVRDRWRRAERERRALRLLFLARRDEPVPTDGVDLRTLVTALPDRLRAVVLLHYYADYPVREVARLLGKAEGTVKSDLHDARGRLRDGLEASS